MLLCHKRGLQVPCKQPRRRVASQRYQVHLASKANGIWAYDFMFDTCANGTPTERSRTSGAYFVVVFMDSSSQEWEPPRKLGDSGLHGDLMEHQDLSASRPDARYQIELRDRGSGPGHLKQPLACRSNLHVDFRRDSGVRPFRHCLIYNSRYGVR